MSLTAEQRRALEVLATGPHGVTEGLLVLGHGFDSDMIVGLVRSGLARARRASMKAGGKTIEVVHRQDRSRWAERTRDRKLGGLRIAA